MGGAGLYSFGQFVDADATLRGQASTGASEAGIGSRGVFGGIGYGMEDGTRFGFFIGGLDSNQSLGALGARTDGNSLLVGAYADLRLGNIGLHGLLARDGGDVDTKRTIASGDTTNARYDLSSWVADVSADYQAQIGAVAIATKLGITYVHTASGAVAAERGGGDLGLSVSAGSTTNWFADASLALSGTFDLGGMALRPYAELGVRQLLNDGTTKVSGKFVGAGSGIVVDGVERADTAGRYGLGFGLDLAGGVQLQLSYSGEFSGSRRNSVMGGLSLRF
jgi:hypothetical protein